MDKDKGFVLERLLMIKKKHSVYLIANNLKIMLITRIDWEKPISAHCVGILPFELTWDIESIFWTD